MQANSTLLSDGLRVRAQCEGLGLTWPVWIRWRARADAIHASPIRPCFPADCGKSLSFLVNFLISDAQRCLEAFVHARQCEEALGSITHPSILGSLCSVLCMCLVSACVASAPFAKRSEGTKSLKFALRFLQYNIKPQPAHRTEFPLPVMRPIGSIRPLGASDPKPATPFHSQVSAHLPQPAPSPTVWGPALRATRGWR